jgi:hypothetical protein
MASEVAVYRITEGDQRLDVARDDNGTWVLRGPLMDVLSNSGRGALPGATYADEQVAQDAAGTLLRALNDFLDLSDSLATNG